MNDPPGVQSALGIEAVEWFAEGGENLTVRVTGRWRRRRPAWGGQPALVVEAQGKRHRFPAMPEPPSLTGAVPGTWRISFSVPAWLAPYLGGRAWLQFGAVVVALPMDVEPAGAPVGAAPEPGGERQQSPQPLDPETLTERRLRSAELAAESARRRAADAEDAAAELAARIEEFERELVQARRDSARLSTLLTEVERRQRAAQQLAHAEQSLRLELEEELAGRVRESESARGALGELAATEERVRELEREIERLRRRADEAEQSAATARAARDRAERQQVERQQAEREHAEREQAEREQAEREQVEREQAEREQAEREQVEREQAERAAADQQALAGLGTITAATARSLGREREMAAHHAASWRRVPSEPSARFVLESLGGLGAEAAEPMVRPDAAETVAASPKADALAHTVLALRRELDTRASAEARLRSQLVAAQGRLEARLAAESQLSATLAQLRLELDGLRSDVEREATARSQAERRAGELEQELREQSERSERAYEAIEELRRTLEIVRAFQTPPPAPTHPAGPVQPERLSEALSRLRETIAREFTDEEEGADDAKAAGPPAEPEPAEPPAAQAPEPWPAEPDPAEPPAAQAPEPPPPPTAPETSASQQPAPPQPPAPPGERLHKAWLEPVFRTLTKRDPAAAGRMLVGLLPAQRAAYPQAVAYDLVLGGEVGCVQVTVRDGVPQISFTDAARELREVDFQAVGGFAELAELLTAGPLRRRFGRGVARVRGDRAGLAALRALVRAPLHLRELHEAGVRLDPMMALTVASLMIDPAWTAGERFTIAHQEAGVVSASLEVRDGGPPTVAGTAPATPVTTTIVCPADSLLLVLTGERPAEMELAGEARPLELVAEWIKRAQSG